ncbi:hypothetical protein QBC32DRAFT_219329, partial [Pseudoneurospora amorphoporcata]
EPGRAANHGGFRYEHILFDPINPHTQCLQDHCMNSRPMHLHPCSTGHRATPDPMTVYIPTSCFRPRKPYRVIPDRASLARTNAHVDSPAVSTRTSCQQSKSRTEMEPSGKYYGYPTDVLLHLFIPSVVTGFPASSHDSHKPAHVRPHTQGSNPNLALAEIEQQNPKIATLF